MHDLKKEIFSKEHIKKCAFSPCGNYFGISYKEKNLPYHDFGSDFRFQLYKIHESEKLIPIEKPIEGIKNFAFSKTGKMLILSHKDHMNIYTITNNTILHIQRLSNGAKKYKFNSNDTVFAYTQNDIRMNYDYFSCYQAIGRPLYIYHIIEDGFKPAIAQPIKNISTFKLRPFSKNIIGYQLYDQEQTFQLYDFQSNTIVLNIEGVLSFTFSKNGKHLFIHTNKTIDIYTLPTDKEIIKDLKERVSFIHEIIYKEEEKKEDSIFTDIYTIKNFLGEIKIPKPFFML